MTQPVAQRVAEDIRVRLTREMRRNPNTGRLEQLKQSELAAAIGMSQPALSRRLMNEIAFDLRELESVCDALDLVLEVKLTPREDASGDGRSVVATPGTSRGDDTP
jgi:transcriptional regulator with XRE-family HTH domain